MGTTKPLASEIVLSAYGRIGHIVLRFDAFPEVTDWLNENWEKHKFYDVYEGVPHEKGDTYTVFRLIGHKYHAYKNGETILYMEVESSESDNLNLSRGAAHEFAIKAGNS